jgi:hypothetical protein
VSKPPARVRKPSAKAKASKKNDVESSNDSEPEAVELTKTKLDIK